MKIAILGAGAAGLSAAERLKEKGFSNVVIFEKSARVGGQALSDVYTTPTGEKIIYDMGSIQPMPNKELNALIKKAGVHFGRGLSLKKSKLLSFYDFDKRAYIADFKNHYCGYPLSKLPALIGDIFKLGRELWRFRKLKKPGFHGYSHLRELSTPLQQWLEQKQFHLIGDNLIFSLCSTASGSSKARCASVPAIYGVKNTFQMLGKPFAYIDGSYQPVREGYQALWTAIAKNHEVRLGTQIKILSRDEKGVTLSVNGDEENKLQFDKLIIACPIERVKNIIPMTAEEQHFADRVHYCPVWRGWLIAKNLPKDRVMVFPENYFSDDADHRILLPILIPEGDINSEETFYSFILQTGTGEIPPSEALLARTALKLKAHFNGEITQWGDNLHYWKYYKPYFNCEDVANGIYDKIENMQGKNHTYYAGSLLSGDGHAHVAAYSFDLIDRFFPL